MQRYTKEQEERLKKFYRTLNERDRRRFLSMESEILGHGSIKYLSNLFDVSERTINRGKIEFKKLDPSKTDNERIRKGGAGKKPYIETYPELDSIFLEVLKNNTAGDPMDTTVKWTNLKQDEIAELIEKQSGIKISRTVVRELLSRHNYRPRKAQKSLPMKEVKNRNAQFEKISYYKDLYIELNYPIISIDTKKKEYIGNFYREEHLYCTETIFTFDHDFNSFAEGVIIPYGIYDYRKNKGFMYLGNSKDTSEFGCNNIKKWWINYGQKEYKDAKSILVLCDGGGSNHANHYLFKEYLQKLSDDIGVEIRIAHYPPYTSKYNPIEHRLFCYISKTWAGVIFDSIKTVKQLIEKTTTKKGLEVVVEIVDKVYRTGRKYKEDFKESMSIIFDDKLPKWNYKTVPAKFS